MMASNISNIGSQFGSVIRKLYG
jgi:hypothetical protein